MSYKVEAESGDPSSGKREGVSTRSRISSGYDERWTGMEAEPMVPKRLSASRAVWSARVKKGAAYMHKHFRQNICLEDVANFVGMDKSSFCRAFKKNTHMTFTQYLNHLRLEETTKLLSSSGDYVFHIARKAGFRSTRHFRRLFRKRYRVSPREYQGQHFTPAR